MKRKTFLRSIKEIYESNTSKLYREKITLAVWALITSIAIYLLSTLSKLNSPLRDSVNSGVFSTIITIILTVFSVSSLIYFLLYEKIITPLVLCIIFVSLFSYFNSILPIWKLVLILIMIVLVVVLYPFFVLKWEKPNYWILGSITVMLFCLVFGLMLISSLYGYNPAKFDIYPKETNLSIEFGKHFVSCNTPNTNKIYVDSNATCNFDINDLNISRASLLVINHLGQARVINLSDMTFLVPENISVVYFEFDAIYKNQTTMLVSDAKTYTFYTYDESKEREQSFVLYLLALIGIIAFSLPAMLNNLKNLSR